MIIGLGLAALCALATNVAYLLKHRGAVAAPKVDARRPLTTFASLFRSRWWAIGWAVAVLAWVLHVGALALAPLSLVQAVISGGLVFLAVIAQRWFGLRLGRQEWTGLGITALGLAFLGFTTVDSGHPAPGNFSLAALIAMEGGLAVLGALAVALPHRFNRLCWMEGALLGAAAGAMYGLSNISIKVLAEPVAGDPFELISPWAASAVAAAVFAFYASARGLQIGPAIQVITVTSVAANLAAIVGGILVFREPIGEGAVEIVLRVTAFLLVVAGAAFMPGPVHGGPSQGLDERPRRPRPRPRPTPVDARA